MEIPFREGPWRAEDDDGLPCVMAGGTMGRNADCIATVNPFEDDHKATLAAIVALPALYEALHEMVDVFWGVDDDHADDYDDPPACIVRARAALRAARGEQGDG